MRTRSGILVVLAAIVIPAAQPASAESPAGRPEDPSAATAPLQRIPLRFARRGHTSGQGAGAFVTPIPVAAASGSSTDERLPLTRPSLVQEGVSQPVGSRGGGYRALSTVLVSLAIVLGLFFGIACLTRRTTSQGLRALPTEVIESLGRAPLAARQQMQLIRLGNRLLLLCVTAQGAETLAEITDPAEVDRLAGLCQQQRPGSVSSTFRQVMSQYGAEAAPQPSHGAAAAARSRRAG